MLSVKGVRVTTMPTPTKLNFSGGHILQGVVIDAHQFVTAIPTAQLFQIAPDPRLAEDERFKKRDRITNVLAELRSHVQRLFAGAKAKNVPSYASYLSTVNSGQPGISPAIILWTTDQLLVEDGDREFARVQIPYGHPLVAIDGETQLAARYEAANQHPDIMHEKVPVIICHGRSVNWARQVFHDVNTFGVKPNASMAVSMDERDPITSLARDIADEVPFLKGRVNFARRQLRRTDHEVVTISTLRLAVLAFVGGTPALQKGAKPEVNPETVSTLREVAVQWFQALSQALGPLLEDRDKLAVSAPAWVAFGAMGHTLLDVPQEERAERIAQYLRQLSEVRWDRTQAWSGIIGKMGANESFAIGSTKEVIHQLVRALSDETDPGYQRIRGQVAA